MFIFIFKLNLISNCIFFVYNLFGEKVSTLADGFHQKGTYRMVWEGTGVADRQLSSGIYFIRLKTSRTSISEKVILLK
ncbi:T9SS type A sorting domain-containing protein [bacterium]|nr:T9SS type A sorting domain-containing protein [bacterium]